MKTNESARIFLLAVALLTMSVMARAQEPNSLTRKEKKNGWILLFDGISTKGWTTLKGEPVTAGCKINDGILSTSKGEKRGDIITAEKYSDFDLMVEYNIEPGGNSSVKYFFTKYDQGGNLGMEYQILDDVEAEDNKLADHFCRSFYDVMPPDQSGKRLNPPGEWNSIRNVSRGTRIEHWLNGVRILEFVKGNQEYIAGVADSKFIKTVPPFGMFQRMIYPASGPLKRSFLSQYQDKGIKIKPI
jgi:hypothetical protein